MIGLVLTSTSSHRAAVGNGAVKLRALKNERTRRVCRVQGTESGLQQPLSHIGNLEGDYGEGRGRRPAQEDRQGLNHDVC